MRFAWLTWPAALLLVALTAKFVMAEWKFPNLNPFASKPKKTTFRLTGSRTPPPPKPSTWQKMTRSTGKFVSKTTDFFTPSFMKKKKAPPQAMNVRAPTGSRRVIRAAPEPPKKSFFSWLWPEKDEPRASKDISSFLLQDRPDF